MTSTRTAAADDKPAMWQLYESAMRPHIEVIWGWDAAWQAAYFEDAFTAASTLVVEVAGRFAGYVQIDHRVEEDYLSMLVLRPEFRSSGIGARLLADVLGASHREGRNLSLRVFRTNDAARRFYEREGWQFAADEGNFVRMEFGAIR